MPEGFEKEIHIKNIFDAAAELHKLQSGAVGFDKKGRAALGEKETRQYKELTAYIEALLEEKKDKSDAFQLLECVRTQEKKPSLAQLSFATLEDFFEAMRRSLGGLGCYVKTNTLLSLNDEVKLQMRILKPPLAFELAGKVVFVNPPDRRLSGQASMKNLPVGFSVHFSNLTAEQKEILDNFVNKGEIERLRELGAVSL